MSLKYPLSLSSSSAGKSRSPNSSRKKPKRHIEREKGEETGGGDKAWNSEKQSSRSLLQFPSHRQRKRLKGHIEREKDEETGGGDKAWNSEKQSSRSRMQFPSHRQEELRKIYGKRTKRNVNVTFGSEQDSESSEEEEGISEEEFKRTEGWKLFKEALDAHTKCNNSAKK